MSTPTGQYSGGRPASEEPEVVAVEVTPREPAAPSLTLRQLRSLTRLLEPLAQEWTVIGRLRRLISAACTAVNADYVAFGLLGPDGGYERLLLSPAERQGQEEMRAILAAHGFAEASTSAPLVEGVLEFAADKMDRAAFLVVPLDLAQGRLGNLFVMSREGVLQFGALDQQLVMSLCEIAKAGLENIDQYEESLLRQQWLRAAGEVSQRLVNTAVDELEVWQVIASSIHHLAQARTVTISVPSGSDPGQVNVLVAVGAGASVLVGQQYPSEGSIAGLALSSSRGHLGRPGLYSVHELVSEDMDDGEGLGQVMAVPLVSSAGVHGAIVVSRRRGDQGFRTRDLAMAGDFAGQAVLALERAEARSVQEQLRRLEDRERIARDLHDHVVQSLFVTGLDLSAALRDPHASAVPEMVRRVWASIAALDATAAQIRSAIFDLRQIGPASSSVRALTDQMLAELAPFELPLTLCLTGPVDTPVPPGLAADLTAVLRESLTNVHKHARATAVVLTLHQGDRDLTVTVEDDGVGLGTGGRRSGLVNLRSRAARAGGTLTLGVAARGGLQLRWATPHTAEDQTA